MSKTEELGSVLADEIGTVVENLGVLSPSANLSENTLKEISDAFLEYRDHNNPQPWQELRETLPEDVRRNLDQQLELLDLVKAGVAQKQ